MALWGAMVALEGLQTSCWDLYVVEQAGLHNPILTVAYVFERLGALAAHAGLAPSTVTPPESMPQQSWFPGPLPYRTADVCALGLDQNRAAPTVGSSRVGAPLPLHQIPWPLVASAMAGILASGWNTLKKLRTPVVMTPFTSSSDACHACCCAVSDGCDVKYLSAPSTPSSATP